MSKETEIKSIESDIAKMEANLLSAKASIKRLREVDPYLIGIGWDYWVNADRSYSFKNEGSSADLTNSECGFVFKTETECLTHSKWEVLDTKIRKFAQDYNAGWVPDYSNPNEDKLILSYEPRKASIQRSASYYCEDGRLKFKDRLSLDKLLILVSEEEIKFWLTYIKPIYTLELKA